MTLESIVLPLAASEPSKERNTGPFNTFCEVSGSSTKVGWSAKRKTARPASIVAVGAPRTCTSESATRSEALRTAESVTCVRV